MNLHTPQEHPDWAAVDAGKLTTAQQLAVATGGIVTLANLVSVTGLLVVGLGAWKLAAGHWLLGLILVGCGRLADLADGYVADLTKTKSRLGEAIDSICDKLAMATIAVTLFAIHLQPLWFLYFLVAHNLLFAIFGIVWGRRYRLHANQYAKLAMFVSWLAIICAVLQQRHTLPPLGLIEFVVISLYIVLVCAASYHYSRDLRAAIQQRQAAAQWTHEVTDFLCIGNRRATHADAAQKLLHSLDEALKRTPVIVDLDTHEQTIRQMLAKQPKDRTFLMAIAGGDGTVSAVVNNLMRLQEQHRSTQFYVLPLWGGNANDLAYMLNGPRLLTTARRLTTRSTAVPIPLIKVQLREREKTQTIYACCYVTFGASAYTANQLNAHRFSTKRAMRWFPPLLLIREFFFVFSAMSMAPLHTSKIGTQEQAVYEHMMINGPRFAKVNRVPMALSQPAFFHVLVTHKDPSVLLSLVKILLHQSGTEYSAHTHVQFTPKSGIEAQIDGEVMRIEPGTRITVSTVQTTLQFISTKLA